MTQPVLLLEDYFLTRLHLDWHFPPDGPAVQVKKVRSQFDYEVAKHTTDPRRRMLKFRAAFQELDANQQHLGHRVECEVVGLFSFTEATPKDKEEFLIRVNGISMLYGALRGLLTSATGAFPSGRFAMPSIMPQDIVNEVETRHAEEAAKAKPPSEPAAATPVNPTPL